MALRYIETTPTSVSGHIVYSPTTPPYDVTEGNPTGPTGITVGQVFDSAYPSRTDKQITGINYYNSGSAATAWDAGVSQFNDYNAMLYAAVKRLTRLDQILGNNQTPFYGENISLFVGASSQITFSGFAAGPSNFIFTFLKGGGDPRGYDIYHLDYNPDDPYGPLITVFDYHACLVPGMKCFIHSSSNGTVGTYIQDINYFSTDPASPYGQGLITFQHNVPTGANSIEIWHDNMQLFHRAFPLYQNYPTMNQHCMPAIHNHIRTLINDPNDPYIHPLASQAIKVNGADYTYNELVQDLNPTELAQYQFIDNISGSQHYTEHHQSIPDNEFFSRFYLDKGIRIETDSSIPPQNFYSREGNCGLLRYLGLYLGYPFVWSTADGGDPPGHTFTFPFQGKAYSKVDYDVNGSRVFFKDWLTLAREAGSDNVGILADSTHTFSKHGGDGIPLDIATDKLASFDKFIGPRNIGHTGNFYSDTIQGLSEYGCQRVRPRQIRSLDFTVGVDNSYNDNYAHVKVSSGSVDFQIADFGKIPGSGSMHIKPAAGSIYSYSISGNYLDVYFNLDKAHAQYQWFTGGDQGWWINEDRTMDSGGSVVQVQQHQIYDNPGTYQGHWATQKGSMNYGMRRGDIMSLSGKKFLCVDCEAFHGPDVVGAEKFPDGTVTGFGRIAYVHSGRLYHSNKRDWARFILSGPDGDWIKEYTGSGLSGMTINVQQSAVIPNPSVFPSTLSWCEWGGSVTDITASCSYNLGEGLIHVPSGTISGMGHFYYSGYVFNRQADNPIESAYMMNESIDNILNNGYFALGIPISPINISEQTLWTLPGGGHYLSSNLYSAFGYLSHQDMGCPGDTDISAMVGSYSPSNRTTGLIWEGDPYPLDSSFPTYSLRVPGCSNPTPVYFGVAGGGGGMVGWLCNAGGWIYHYQDPIGTHPDWPGYWFYNLPYTAVRVNTAGIQVFYPTILQILAAEVEQWYITVKMKNAVRHHFHNSATYCPRPGMYGLEYGSNVTEGAPDYIVWHNNGFPTGYSGFYINETSPVTSVGLEMVVVQPATITYNADFMGQMGEASIHNPPTTVSGYTGMGSGIPCSMQPATSYSDGYGTTYTEVLIDATEQIKTIINGSYPSDAQIGIRLSVGDTGSTGNWRLVGPLNVEYTNLSTTPASSGSISGCYYNEAEYTYITFDAVEITGQYCKIKASELIKGTDFYFDSNGNETHGVSFVRH